MATFSEALSAQLLGLLAIELIDGPARIGAIYRADLTGAGIACENEALLVGREISPADFEVVVPSVSILAEPPVAVVDKVVDKRGTRKAAEAYLSFLYAPEGQQLVAKHYYRPRLQEAAEGYPDRFSQLELMHIEDFGGWAKAYKTHFAEGGIFDQIYRPGS